MPAEAPKSSAGGGSASAALARGPADLSSSLLQKELRKKYSNIPAGELPTIQKDPNAPSSDLSFEGFIEYLASPHNTYRAPPDPVKMDLSRPLNEYFISSSHNTYLTGHQLYGKSTTAGYINVLTRGCRCIEIDVWDGDDGEPEVKHGYTLTEEIKFQDVCKAIAKYAFSEADLAEGGYGDGPVIISLENHATPIQQLKIVDIMRSTWGDMLVQGIEPEDVKSLPSPAQLRRKIVVKTKHIPREPAPVSASTTAPQERPSSSSSSSSSSSDSSGSQPRQPKPKKQKLVRALAALGMYCSSYHFPGHSGHPEPFTGHPTSQIPNHVYSFSEKVFKRHAEEYARQIFEHNKRYLMRVYPYGLRLGSSNLDPSVFWRQGVQMVALNWQKADEGMMLNEGMFAGEGGFVLKPEGFRPNDTTPPQTKTLDLKIEIIAAAKIPLPEEDDKPKGFEPYVKVEVHTSLQGVAPLKKRTKSKRGIEAAWNTRLDFDSVPDVIPSLTFVRFKIMDEEFGRDDLAAWACVRLDRLRQGIRAVRLFDNAGRLTDGVLVIDCYWRVT